MRKNINLSSLIYKRWLPWLALAVFAWAPIKVSGQFSISGNTCVLPGTNQPYGVNGSWGPSDKWCVTGGAISGVSNTCVANNNNPTTVVVWNTGVTSGTLSYYHPSTATTPVATITVTMQDGGSVSPGAVFVPSGGTFTINITGSAPTQTCFAPTGYSWLSGPNPSALTPVANGSSNPANFTMTGSWTSSFYIERVATFNGGQVSIPSNPVSIIPQPLFTTGTVTVPSACIPSGTSPGTLTASSANGGNCGTSGFFYEWQSSTDNVNWTQVGPGTSTPGTLSPGNLTTTTYYRQLDLCGPLTLPTNTVTVTVFQALATGTISTPPSTINYNGSPGAINCSAAAGGVCGSPSYGYQWQSSPNNATWSNVSGTGQNYTPGNLTANTWFRRLVSVNGGAQVPSTNSVLITVLSQINATISPATQFVNYGGSPLSPLSITGVTGGNGAYTYMWEYASSPGGTYTASGVPATMYGPGSLTATTWFECFVTSNGATVAIGPVVVNVYPPLAGGSISPGSQTINPFAVPTGLTSTAPSGGNGVYTYQWQYSTDGVHFAPVGGAGASGYNPPGLNTTTWYELITSSNGISVTSAPVVVNVTMTGGTIGGPGSAIAYNSQAGLSNVQQAEGGACGGAYVYQWLSSIDGAHFTPIAGAMGLTYTTPTLVNTTWYVRQATCGTQTVNSNTLTVQVAQPLAPGTITPGSLTIVSGATPGPLTGSEATGGACGGNYSYQWQSSPDGVNFTNLNVSTPSYTPGTLTSTTYYRRMVICGMEVAYTNLVTVAIGSLSSNPNLNYIRVRDILRPGLSFSSQVEGLTDPHDVRQVTQYFDGIDRLMQTVQYQASPLQKDIVYPVVYDPYGHPAIKYMRYTANTNDGNFKPTSQADQESFNAAQFPSEQYYYSQTDFESSPLDRPLNVFPMGASWMGSGRGITQRYLLNTVEDSVQIWDIAFAAGSIPTSSGIYPDGSLYKHVTTDAQGNQVVEYVNNTQQTVLKKVQNAPTPGTAHVGWSCTYYVYDDLDELRFVISPQAVVAIDNGPVWNIPAAVATELCYRYEFDTRRRMAVKQVAGAGETWTVYDALDRTVMSQDALLRSQGKWLVNQYDNEFRAYQTGLLTDPNNLTYHQGLAAASTAYPVIGSEPFETLTRNYYDDYSWVAGTAPALGTSLATTYTGVANDFVTTYGVSPVYAVQIAELPMVRNMITGTMKKVLNSSPVQYLYSTNFFDDHARLIQTQAINYTGGVDTLTVQYDFSGKPLRMLLNHQKNQHTAQHHNVLTKMDYDANFRLKHVWKNIDGAASDQLVDSAVYDELGQLRTKYLGNDIDSLVYDYNVRGWLTGINRNYVGGTTNHYFGLELGFDKNSSIISTTSYSSPKFNGNIAGEIWKSAGDGVGRKYDFSYDNANRLTAAAYTDNKSGSWGTTMMDFSVSNLRYDANGNILSMYQNGFKVGAPGSPIDQLTYTYLPNTNKLLQVSDGVNDPNSILGDLHYKTATKTSTDYAYDVNGNLSLDNNKAIDHIHYDYLNLPDTIHVNGKGTISYTYDAGGTKLQKLTLDSTNRHSTTTLYVDEFVYQQCDSFTNINGGTDTLKFLDHEEGRTRWAYHKYLNGSAAYGWEYDFFEKDHLGNTRVILSQEKDTAQYLASMETAYRNTENSLFYNIPASSYPRGSAPGYPVDLSTTNPNDSVARLNGSGQKVGPAIILKVMSGDVVNIKTSYFYNSSGVTPGQTLSVSDLINSLANGIVNVTGGAHGSFATLSGGSSPLVGALGSYITNNSPNGGATKPNAYLNWMLLDDQFNYVGTYPQSGALQVGSSGTQTGGTLQAPLGYTGIPITKSGYLYIFVSNATPGWDVFFDNLSVTTYAGRMLEEDHYYPFGLTMAAISDKAMKSNYAENKYRLGGKELQNKEFSDGSGLEDYDFGARFYDPQIGRWQQIDPLAEYMRRWSPYASCFDDPVSFADGNGMAASDSTAKPKPPPSDEPTGKLAEVQQLQEVVVKGYKKKSHSWLSIIWDAVDYVPIVGSLKQIGVGIAHGSWKEAGLGVVMLGVDVFTGGEGGEAIRLAEKGAQVLVEDELKEVAEKEVAEQIAKDEGTTVADDIVHGNSSKSKVATEKYTITDEAGKEYHGVGKPGKRAEQSLKRLEKENPGKTFTVKDRTTFPNRAGALKAEANGLKGKTLKVDVYNKINSPGAKL
jgi:RHS repeat-associated protein